jgi:2-phospho-L-lactate/phosphoenolpyruvate guanylyltransferase
MSDGTYAVIPVKPFVSAKRRLSPLLNCMERIRLARFMLEDVIDAVRSAPSLAGFFVVSCHEDAAALAEAAGGRAIREEAEFGLAQAVATAFREIAPMAAGAVVVPADIPHLPAATIDAVIAKTGEGGVTLVPAIYDGGTNLLALRPCTALRPLFGPGSFQRHHRAALRAGLSPRIHVCPRAGHDLDRPRDLVTFLTMESKTRTHDYLADLGIYERLEAFNGAPSAASRAPASA